VPAQPDAPAAPIEPVGPSVPAEPIEPPLPPSPPAAPAPPPAFPPEAPSIPDPAVPPMPPAPPAPPTPPVPTFQAPQAPGAPAYVAPGVAGAAYGQQPYGQQPPGPPAPGSPYPPYGPPAPPQGGRFNGLGLASLITGGVAFLLAFVPFVNYGSGVLAVIGIVLGIIGLVIKFARKGLAIAGLIVSGVALILTILLAIVYTLGFVNAVNNSIENDFPSYAPIDPSDNGSSGGGQGEDSGSVISAHFGGTVSYDDGVTLSVSSPSAYTPSDTASGADQAANVVFTITIYNGSSSDLDPLPLSNVTSGGVDGSSIVDFDNNLNGFPPVDTLPAGQTLTYQEAWSVADPRNIVYETSPSFDYTTAQFK
jgi:hypothetical protein